MSGLAAIILAGGRSARMGRDKAAIPWGGQTAVARVAQLAREAGAQPVIVAGGDYGLPYAADPIAHGGPVGGLLAGVAALPDAACFLVLAVDAPSLALTDLWPLLAAPAPGAAYAGYLLPMALARDAIPRGLDAACPLRRFVELAGLPALAPPLDALARLRGANTPEELKALRRFDRARPVIP